MTLASNFMMILSSLVGRVKLLQPRVRSIMADIRDNEPPLEGQKGFKGPAIFARFFSSRVERQSDRDK